MNHCISFLLSIILLVGCTSKKVDQASDKQIQDTTPAAVESTESIKLSEYQTNKLADTAKNNGTDILSYFFMLYPKGSGKPVSGLQFEDKSIRNGYLKVIGNMEGYYIYDLFKGPTEDYVIEQGTGCGPECEQSFKVYVFQSGKLLKTQKFESFYPRKKVEAHIAKMKSSLPKGHTKEDLQSWIRLPKTGTHIDLLILEQNPGATQGNVGVYQIGSLNWNGQAFDFVPTFPKEPSKIQILDVQ